MAEAPAAAKRAMPYGTVMAAAPAAAEAAEQPAKWKRNKKPAPPPAVRAPNPQADAHACAHMMWSQACELAFTIVVSGQSNRVVQAAASLMQAAIRANMRREAPQCQPSARPSGPARCATRCIRSCAYCASCLSSGRLVCILTMVLIRPLTVHLATAAISTAGIERLFRHRATVSGTDLQSVIGAVCARVNAHLGRVISPNRLMAAESQRRLRGSRQHLPTAG